MSKSAPFPSQLNKHALIYCEDFEKLQQKRRRMDIENMADFDEQEEYGNYRNDPDLMNDEDLDELDEWKDN